MPGLITAVILAAGLSRRMGSPKMLLPWGGTSVLGQTASVYAEAGVTEIVVVTGGAQQAVEAECRRLAATYPLRWVNNPDYERGEMISSLQCGLAFLKPEIEAALVGLGDQPQLSLAAVQMVVSTWVSTDKPLIVPSPKLRRGHPWLLRRELWGSLLALPPADTLRDFLNSHASEIVYVDTDETVLKDLDTPADYQREKP